MTSRTSVSIRPFSCRRGSLCIRGTEFRPAGDRLPVAVVCHGFMANQLSVRGYAMLLAKNGYAAYTFDFCGGCAVLGKSDGKSEDMSVLTEVEDLKAVLDYLQTLPYLNPKHVLLMGCSQGGFVAALTAARLAQKPRGLVLFYPAFCIPDDARAGRMLFARFDPKNIPARIDCGPMKLGAIYVRDVIDLDPFAEIAPYRGEVLLVQGGRDRIVAPRYAKKALAAYAGAHARLLLVPSGEHGFFGKAEKSAREALRQFLFHLKQQP